jgi:hypothetical protein
LGLVIPFIVLVLYGFYNGALTFDHTEQEYKQYGVYLAIAAAVAIGSLLIWVMFEGFMWLVGKVIDKVFELAGNAIQRMGRLVGKASAPNYLGRVLFGCASWAIVWCVYVAIFDYSFEFDELLEIDRRATGKFYRGLLLPPAAASVIYLLWIKLVRK